MIVKEEFRGGLDENNHYVSAVAKHFPRGFFKHKKKALHTKKIQSSDQNVTLKDLLGHIFIVDMEFNQSKSNVHTLICNKR